MCFVSNKCQPATIWRFVNNKFLNKFNELAEDCFSLRRNEKSVSFFHSPKQKRHEQLKEVHKILTLQKNFNVKMPGTYLSLDIPEALDLVNDYNEIIKFQDRKYPHVDLFYVSDDFDEVHEAKTVLTEISKLEVIHGDGVVRQLT